MDKAMSKAKGFIGKPKRTAIPALCAKCHSDANFMQKYKPQERVDQFQEYKTSVHGKLLATGDEGVATCIDCHGAHGVRDVKDPQAAVYPLHIPQTCATCHGNAEHMAKYKIPTNQFKEYETSVHWEALSKRMDLSAPSCASCHGNHGAKPPQAASTAAVCGTCHALVEQLYKGSPHQPVFASMGLAGCVTCHQNHAVKRPTDAFLGGKDAVCSTCHDADSKGGKASAAMYKSIHDLDESLNRAEAILSTARRAGMEVSEPTLQLQDAKDRLIKARVAIHNFRPDAVRAPVEEGLKIADASYKAGEEAMSERTFRRSGLAVSLVAILLTICGLFLAIRAIEARKTS
jgi:cytochrome c553